MKPTLIVIGGFAGSGKSTLARSLGYELPLPVFEIDAIARMIQQSPSYDGSSNKRYPLTFDLFFGMARQFLANNCSLILDQNMGHEITWRNLRAFRAEVERSNAIGQTAVKIFLLDCPYELCLARFATRTEHPNLHDVTFDDIDDHKHKWHFVQENDFPDAIRIDATRSQEDVFAEVLDYLDAKRCHLF
ncbi:MAG: AAA family ATPase [Chloroflexota bacterium]